MVEELFDLVRVADGKVLVRADRETVARVASLFTRGGFEVREEK